MSSLSDMSSTGIVIDESLSNLLADETDHGHDFVDHLMTGSSGTLIKLGSGQKEAANSVINSAMSQKSNTKKSLWHGSCASFIGSSNELLNLSLSSYNSDESSAFLSTQINTLACPTRHNLLEGKRNTFSTNSSTYLLPPKDSKRTSHYVVPDTLERIRLSPFVSKSVNEVSDTLPKKPIRQEVDDDEDDEFTEIITENPYETIQYSLEQRLIILDDILNSSNVLIDDLDEIPRRRSTSLDVKKKQQICESGQQCDTRPELKDSMPFQRSKSTSSFLGDDEAPKCPIRRPSPMRSSRQ